jgi:hypothetical protein
MFRRMYSLHIQGRRVRQASSKQIAMIAACLAYSSTLKMENVHSCKIPVNFHQTEWRHFQYDSTLHIIVE